VRPESDDESIASGFTEKPMAAKTEAEQKVRKILLKVFSVRKKKRKCNFNFIRVKNELAGNFLSLRLEKKPVGKPR